MNTSPKAVHLDDDTLWVRLSDGRTIGAPLAWFPRLLEATPEQRAEVELSKSGLHWDALDEDLSAAGLLVGQPDLSPRGLICQPDLAQTTESPSAQIVLPTAEDADDRRAA